MKLFKTYLALILDKVWIEAAFNMPMGIVAARAGDRFRLVHIHGGAERSGCYGGIRGYQRALPIGDTTQVDFFSISSFEDIFYGHCKEFRICSKASVKIKIPKEKLLVKPRSKQPPNKRHKSKKSYSRKKKHKKVDSGV